VVMVVAVVVFVAESVSEWVGSAYKWALDVETDLAPDFPTCLSTTPTVPVAAAIAHTMFDSKSVEPSIGPHSAPRSGFDPPQIHKNACGDNTTGGMQMMSWCCQTS